MTRPDYPDEYDDYDAEEEVRSQKITHLYQLRHTLNVIDLNYVDSHVNLSEDRILLLYHCDAHGSEKIKPFTRCTDERFEELVLEAEQRTYEHRAKITQTRQKHQELITSLKVQRKQFAGLGTNKVKRRLNKLALTSVTARAVRLALQIEDTNISAKDSYRPYQDKIYRQKEKLIKELGQLFQDRNWTYGIQDSEVPLATYVIYFEIPGCGQLSWHCSLDQPDDKFSAKSADFPSYPNPWDRKENSTLAKLEVISLRLLTEHNLLKP